MDYTKQSKLTLSRILIDLQLKGVNAADKAIFKKRLEMHFEKLFTCYHKVYGWQYDFYYHLQALVKDLALSYAARSRSLKLKDQEKLATPNWYRSNDMLGMACYVDLYGGDFVSLQKRIPYLKSKGINYLHLMPLYKSPEGDSDGGYAVSDYRQTNPSLGSVDELRNLASALRKAGINLVLDFVFNHTSDEHEWALKAKQGDPEFQQYYYMFDDKTLPNRYERTLREIFPQVRRGNFTFEPDSQKWVWTTFNNFQWDLNYSNPTVFNAITQEMLFLANLGCDALRLDALAFIWKEMGTTCENQDNAHTLIQAFNACLQIVSPAVVFKSEAIVHPDEVIKYISPDECQLSYNPLLMALIWNSLATRKTRLITASMQKTGNIDANCTWVNYVRCHDDIGWTFDDELSKSLGIDGNDHRRFLNQFYTGRYEGSFASGIAFGENPSTGDCRVCGSLASLCGLEKAIGENDASQEAIAVKRILLVHSIILSIGGIPLLYAGDELGLTNDYSFRNDSSKAHDERWVQRIGVSDEQIIQSPHPVISQGLDQLIQTRQRYGIFGGSQTHFIDAPNEHCFAYLRINESAKLLCVVNFSEFDLHLDSGFLSVLETPNCVDLISNNRVDCTQTNKIGTYQSMWLYVE
jgi:amylosucrase